MKIFVRRRVIDSILAEIEQTADEIEVAAIEAPDEEISDRLVIANLNGMVRGLRLVRASITDRLDGIVP